MSIIEQLKSTDFSKVVFIVHSGYHSKNCMIFLNYIRYTPGESLGSSYLDNHHNVLYVIADVWQELSLFKIETLKKKIQIVFVDRYDQFFMNDFNAFLETLSPLNRMLLTQHISVVNMDPSSLVSVYKFSIGVFNLQYEDGQRYYSIYKISSKELISKLSKDGCFVKLIDPSHDLKFNEVTEEVSPIVP